MAMPRDVDHQARVSSEGDDLVLDETAALTAAACLFRSLGDRSRLAILRHLVLGEHRVVELTAHLGLAQSTVSAHLACLRDCGLVTSQPRARSSVFALAPGVEARLLPLLSAAEQVLAVTGDAVILCPVLDRPVQQDQQPVPEPVRQPVRQPSRQPMLRPARSGVGR